MTRPPLPRDLRGTPTYEWVEGLLHDLRATGPDHIVDLTDLTTSPDGTTIAMTAWRRSTVSSDLTPTVAILTLATRALRTEEDVGGNRALGSDVGDHKRLKR